MPAPQSRSRIPAGTGDPDLDRLLREISASLDDVFFSYRSTSSDYTFAATDQIIEAYGSNTTTTLPLPPDTPGKVLRIKNWSGGNHNVRVAYGKLIDSYTTITLANEEALTVFSNGSQWRIG